MGQGTSHQLTRTSPMTGPLPLHPAQMDAKERLTELSLILATGLVRLRARQSSDQSECSADRLLGCGEEESVCRTPCNGESPC
jgi:hypothetical protein